MNRHSSIRRIALLAVPAIVAATLALAGQPTAETSRYQAGGGAGDRYRGASSCLACHSRNKQPELIEEQKVSKDHIKLDEYTTWQSDKHGSAYQNLTGKLGKEMETRLGKPILERSTGCMGCHSASAQEISNRVGGEFKITDGVSCENCHGPSDRWFGEHSDWRKWRLPKDGPPVTAAYKASLGLTDLRDPVSQTTKCLSCHVGNVKEGKVVTHEMYAVGHPPLPSIEVAQFADNMRHWWLIREKPETKKDPKGLDADKFERSRLVLVGAAMALKTAMTQLAEESNFAGVPVPGETWPDYARFDCASCHHELQRPSWRQERGYKGTPGRPPVARWPLVTVRLGIEKLVAEKNPAAQALLGELDAHDAALSAATSARPFGRKAALKDVATAYASWASGLADKLAAAKYDQQAVTALLKGILDESKYDAPDYEASRHAVWAAWSFYRDLQPDPENDAAGKKLDTEIREQFKVLSKGLNLNLPVGQNDNIARWLPEAFKESANYEPAQFKEDLKGLSKKLMP